MRGLADRIWFGTDTGSVIARAALTPASWLFATVSGVRNSFYDRGVLRAQPAALPAISVGNLSVGGTGKTPIAAWIAAELIQRGAHPAIVLRGYGDDEPEVHRRLNPDAIVVAASDRVAGIARAAAEGADVAVLDDAFQHRRAARDVDIVLVSADRWPDRVRHLPSGPFREGLRSLERASAVIVTRKAASRMRADAVARALSPAAAAAPVAVANLTASGILAAAGSPPAPLATIAGRPVLAICGVGDPAAFEAQLAAAGARVSLRAFADHHPYTPADVVALVREAHDVAAAGGVVACTLKDAVKLSPLWPSGAPGLSIIIQQVILESGQDAFDRLLESVLAARRPAAIAAG